jgi:hypothetical protein
MSHKGYRIWWSAQKTGYQSLLKTVFIVVFLAKDGNMINLYSYSYQYLVMDKRSDHTHTHTCVVQDVRSRIM